MKPKAIILLVLLAVAIGFVMSTYMEASESATFEQAEANPDKEYHITGFLVKDKPIEYNPLEDANRFTFYLKDKDGEIRKVISSEPKMQDFEKTETVSMTGRASGEDFLATKVLPKCPSKYKDQQDNATAAAE
ncbi:MAG: cytochrome c maturation protein CcmE [Bacteroidia bacterium]|nr:cytochrome c maturation protein CcmE [Bacteroidia bacterium]